jgi:hypothetical protein
MEIPILYFRAVMVGPRPRVLLTPPLVICVLQPVAIIFIFNIVLPYSNFYGSVQSIAYATLLWNIVVLCRNFEECSEIWPSLLPPHEVDHNSQTVQSCISLEERKITKTASSTLGNRHFLGQWISFVTPHTRWSLHCVSATVECCFH